MKVTRDKTENCQAFLTVEMEPDEIAESMEASYQRLRKKVNIPGFRKGKAPRDMVVRHMGEENMLEDAIKHMVPEAYEKALKEQEIEPYAQPDIEVTQTDPLIFTVVVPLPPKIELGDYQQVKIAPEPVVESEEHVDAVLEEIRHQHAAWEPVERPVEFNDMVVFDIESTMEEKPFIKNLGAPYQVLVNSPTPAPGFAEQLVGMNKGEEKEFTLTYPEDYFNKDMAGKQAEFKVKLSEVKEEKLPELDDELAKLVSPDFTTVDLLREEVRTNLKQRDEEKARLDHEEKVVDAVVGLTDLEYPPILVETEIDRLIREREQYLQQNGANMEMYLKSINKTAEELREDIRPTAVKRVNNTLVLSKVTQAEKIEVTNEEILAEVADMTRDVDETKKEEMLGFFNSPQMRDSVSRSLLIKKTVQRLVDIAQEPDQTQTKEEEEKQ